MKKQSIIYGAMSTMFLTISIIFLFLLTRSPIVMFIPTMAALFLSVVYSDKMTAAQAKERVLDNDLYEHSNY
jgi:hypothetical protein